MIHIFDQQLSYTYGPLFEESSFANLVDDNQIDWWKLEKLYPPFEENSEIETHFFALVRYIRESWCKPNLLCSSSTKSWISVYWVDETHTDVFVEFYSQLFDGKMKFKISKDGFHFILDDTYYTC